MFRKAPQNIIQQQVHKTGFKGRSQGLPHHSYRSPDGTLSARLAPILVGILNRNVPITAPLPQGLEHGCKPRSSQAFSSTISAKSHLNSGWKQAQSCACRALSHGFGNRGPEKAAACSGGGPWQWRMIHQGLMKGRNHTHRGEGPWCLAVILQQGPSTAWTARHKEDVGAYRPGICSPRASSST